MSAQPTIPDEGPVSIAKRVKKGGSKYMVATAVDGQPDDGNDVGSSVTVSPTADGIPVTIRDAADSCDGCDWA